MKCIAWGEMATWDDDSLDYGYMVHRLPDGGWWHLHFARSGLEYHCELLERNTTILASIQCFALGAIAKSEQFILTLDGEGVELPDQVLQLDFDWGRSPEVAKSGRAFQHKVMPLLHDSRNFQRAVWEIVDFRQHLRMVASAKIDPKATRN
jgi:hypothetical protein